MSLFFKICFVCETREIEKITGREIVMSRKIRREGRGSKRKRLRRGSEYGRREITGSDKGREEEGSEEK